MLRSLSSVGSFLIFIFGVSFLSMGQVVIKGKINNYNNKDKIYYTHTSDSVHSIITKELKPKKNGTFTITFKNTGFGTFNCSYKSLNYRFFFTDNSHIYFEIDHAKINYPKRYYGYSGDGVDRGYILDSIKQIATIFIKGNHNEINKFYNKSLRISYGSQTGINGNGFSWLLEKQPSPDRLLYSLDSLLNEEIDQIELLDIPVKDEYYNNTLTIDSIKSFLVNEAKAYYSSILFDVILRKKQQNKDAPGVVDFWYSFADSSFRYLHHFIQPQPNSSDYNELIKQSYTTLNSFSESILEEENIDEFVYKRLLSDDTLLFNDYKTVMIYKMNWLYLFLNSELLYRPALLNAVYSLQATYPNQPLWYLLNPQIDKLKTSVSTKDSRNIVFIESQFVDFADLIDQFKGQNIYLDIWATWCGPCIREFQYNDSIQHMLDAHKTIRLYISVDKPEWRNRWEQSVKYNKLNGFHIRANNELIYTMWQSIGGVEGAIPRYVLINADGNIFISTAASPSQYPLLQKQIRKMLLEK